MKHALLVASLVLLSTQARAVVLYELDPEIRAKTMLIFHAKNENYRVIAAKKLKEHGERYDLARLEISGLLSNDDTYRFNAGDFDDQMKPSYSADKNKNVRDLYTSWMGGNYKRDKDEMIKNMRGEMSARTMTTVARFKDLEINEIVAHSWGSELIYAAILNGEMRPPKKLIVAGVPDDDRAKWDMLAARTGTEVYWARADNDAAAIDKGVKFAKESTGDIDFKAKWDALCLIPENKVCHAHGRKSTPVIHVHIGRFSGLLAHDREDYYAALKKKGVIKGTIGELRAAETAKIESEALSLEHDALTVAHGEAIKLVAEAREQMEIARRENENRNQGSFWDNVSPSKFSRRMAELRSSNPAPGQAAQPIIPVTPVGRTPFYAALPGLKSYAVTACRATGQVPVDMDSINPATPFAFMKNLDDQTADRLSAGLDACESRLFRRLIEVIRAGQGDRVSAEWVQETAASYRPAPPPDRSSGYTPRPPREEPSEPGCYWDSNINARVCPK